MKDINIILGMVITIAMVCSAHAQCSGCGGSQAGNETVIIDLSPKAKILLPGDTAFSEGAAINFAGIFTGQDTCGSACSYAWYSNRDGLVGRGLSIYRSNLSVGLHLIEFKYTDSSGQIWTARKNITVKPLALNAKVASPKPEQFYRKADNIPFEASVKGGVPPYTYSWRLDDKVIGSEKYFELKVSEGTHKVRLEVKDSANSYTTVDRTLWVETPAEVVILPLRVSIGKPKNGQIVKEGNIVIFEAIASGGKTPYTYNWTSDVDGYLGKEKKFNYANLSKGANGSNTVTLTLSDSAGFIVRSMVTLTIKPVCNNDGVCYSGENYLNCPGDCPTGSKDGICDKIKDGICDLDCKWLEDPDCVCNRNGKCDLGVETYANCPQDCISGSQDGICDKVKDGRCDPDCMSGEDADCVKGDDAKYFLLVLLVAVLFFVYLRFIRNR
jgi:hypothetical protein